MLEADNLLDVQQLTELSEIYWLRYPTEACGVIIPSPHKGKRVFEMPNRSMTPQSEYLMAGSDINFELHEWFQGHDGELSGVIFWHTHPSGDPKPSRADREHRVNGAMNLVVTFADREADIQLKWY